MKNRLKVFLAVGVLATLLISATLTQNDSAIFNGKTYFNGVVHFKPLADDGLVLTVSDSSNGKAKWNYLNVNRGTSEITKSYKGFSYTKKLTTSGGSGTVTDTLTWEGTATGTALFSTIHSIVLTPVYSDTVATAIPDAYVKSIGGSNKTITVRVVKGTARGPADSGTEVYMTITGAQ